MNAVEYIGSQGELCGGLTSVGDDGEDSDKDEDLHFRV